MQESAGIHSHTSQSRTSASIVSRDRSTVSAAWRTLWGSPDSCCVAGDRPGGPNGMSSSAGRFRPTQGLSAVLDPRVAYGIG